MRHRTATNEASTPTFSTPPPAVVPATLTAAFAATFTAFAFTATFQASTSTTACLALSLPPAFSLLGSDLLLLLLPHLLCQPTGFELDATSAASFLARALTAAASSVSASFSTFIAPPGCNLSLDDIFQAHGKFRRCLVLLFSTTLGLPASLFL